MTFANDRLGSLPAGHFRGNFGVTEDAQIELPRRTVFGAGRMAGKTHVASAAQVFPDLGSISRVN
jgi:hypothetical protein